MHKLIMLSIFVGSSASIPLLYQANPERFQSYFTGAQSGPEPIARASMVEVPVKPAAVKQLTGKRIQVQMDPRGHFVAEFRLNGRPMKAMVDTGATVVAINRSTAERIGIELSNADFRHQVSTANGRARAAAARISNLQIGRIHITDVEAVVMDDASLNNTLIGMSFLKRLGKFRIENETLLLEQ